MVPAGSEHSRAISDASVCHSRFGWVLAGSACGSDPACDIDLLGEDDVAVLPTLGSLVADWLLVIPRKSSLSFSQLSSPYRERCFWQAQNVADQLRARHRQVYSFEHGAAEINTETGCGVEQAHIHVVPLDFDLIGAAVRLCSTVDWHEVDVNAPLRQIDVGRDYYWVTDKERSFVGYPREKQSQFFRRIIAHALGIPSQWDYRLYPHYDNIAQTIANWPPSIGKNIGNHQRAA